MSAPCQPKRPDLLLVTDLAIREQLSYRGAYDRLLRGDFGRPERIRGRLFVRVTDAKQAAR